MKKIILALHLVLAFLAALTLTVSAAEEEIKWGPGTKILVVGGGSSHDFQKWFNKADVATLRSKEGYSVNYTESAAVTTKELPNIDVLLSSTNQRGFDTPELRAALMNYADSGKGIVLVHPGLWYNWPWPEYNKVLAGGGARSHDALGPFEVKVVKQHPVTKGLPESFKVIDELYQYKTEASGSPIEVLAETSPSGVTKKSHPSIFIVKHPKARIVGIALGHDGRVHDLPEYKTVLLNAASWASGK